jgi:outer membrane protein OmpA-like peptidoglycan-associated protein
MMKQAFAVSILLIACALLFPACVGTDQGKRKSVPADPIADQEGLIIASKRYRYPVSHGVSYLPSEQFLLCRGKEFCPINEGRFTRAPLPSQEKIPLIVPARKNLNKTIKSMVHFASGSAEPDAEAQSVLSELLTQISGTELLGLRVVIAGYTDSTGSQVENEKLARDRAESVASYFRGQGVTFKEVLTGGRADCCPVAPNTTAEGRAENRRAEIWVEPEEEEKGEKTN